MHDELRATADVMRGPLDEFVSRRTDVVRRLRETGEADVARRISGLRKPSLVVWALNQAAVVAGGELAQLRAAGEGVRRAQQRVLGGDPAAAAELQRAAARQRDALDHASRRLTEALRRAGHAAGADVARRVTESLRALSTASDEEWQRLTAGAVSTEPEPAAFPTLDVAAAPLRRKVSQQEDSARRRRLQTAERALARAEALEQSAREQAAAAQSRLAEAERAMRDAQAELQRLRGPRSSR